MRQLTKAEKMEKVEYYFGMMRDAMVDLNRQDFENTCETFSDELLEMLNEKTKSRKR